MCLREEYIAKVFKCANSSTLSVIGNICISKELNAIFKAEID